MWKTSCDIVPENNPFFSACDRGDSRRVDLSSSTHSTWWRPHRLQPRLPPIHHTSLWLPVSLKTFDLDDASNSSPTKAKVFASLYQSLFRPILSNPNSSKSIPFIELSWWAFYGTLLRFGRATFTTLQMHPSWVILPSSAVSWKIPNWSLQNSI